MSRGGGGGIVPIAERVWLSGKMVACRARHPRFDSWPVPHTPANALWALCMEKNYETSHASKMNAAHRIYPPRTKCRMSPFAETKRFEISVKDTSDD